MKDIFTSPSGTESPKMTYPYFKGDYIISTKQKHTLSHDGTRTWSDRFLFYVEFFDGILQRKEYFSDYLFAPVAEKLLANDQNLKLRYLESWRMILNLRHLQVKIGLDLRTIRIGGALLQDLPGGQNRIEGQYLFKIGT